MANVLLSILSVSLLITAPLLGAQPKPSQTTDYWLGQFLAHGGKIS